MYNKPCQVVIITTDKVYENKEWLWGYRENDKLRGFDPYSSSKAAVELLVSSWRNSFFKQSSNIKVATARAGNVIGGGDFKQNRIVPDVIKSLDNKKKIILRNPNATRPWQHVLEPLSGYLLLGHKLINQSLNTKIYPSWNFGPYKRNCKKVIQMTKLFIKEWGNKKVNVVIKKNRKFHESKLLSLNISKAKKELNWEPKLSLDETVYFTVSWYKNFLSEENVEETTNSQIEYFINK